MPSANVADACPKTVAKCSAGCLTRTRRGLTYIRPLLAVFAAVVDAKLLVTRI